MKKLFSCLVMLFLSSQVFAVHYFKICYVNNTQNKVGYINEGPSRLWNKENRKEMVGNGELAPDETKCFNTQDETVVRNHILTFYVNNKWFGIVNPGFFAPYVIGQDATETVKKKGKLVDNTKNGTDDYRLYINIMPEDKFILSNSPDLKDQSQIIQAVKLDK